jgi:hypothetical protein
LSDPSQFNDHILDRAVGWVLALLVVVALVSATFFSPENSTIPAQPAKKVAPACPPVAELQRFSRALGLHPVLRYGLRRTSASCGPTHDEGQTGTETRTAPEVHL